jgi:hypothetical protein
LAKASQALKYLAFALRTDTRRRAKKLRRESHPLIGFFIYTHSQLENSREDGNFICLSLLRPEIGIEYSF